jgi:hypothetical protein
MDVQIAEWRKFAGPEGYGHSSLGCLDDPEEGDRCFACDSDAVVAGTVNAILDALTAAEAKLTAVRNLHATVDARWSSEGPDVKRCRHCKELWPCDTALVVGE